MDTLIYSLIPLTCMFLSSILTMSMIRMTEYIALKAIAKEANMLSDSIIEQIHVNTFKLSEYLTLIVFM